MKKQKKIATVELSNAVSNGVQIGYIRQAFRWFNEVFSPEDEEKIFSKAEMKKYPMRIAIILGIMVISAILIHLFASPERWIRL